MYIPAKLFFSFTKSLSREPNIKFGESIGSLFFKLGYRKKVIIRNLDIAFPEKTLEWKIDIARKSLQNVGRTLTEFSKIPQYIDTGYINEITKIVKGKEILTNRNKGIVFISAHIGNWELGGAGLASKVDGIVDLAYRMKNKKLNQLINGIREYAGIKIIYHDQPLRDFVKALKDGKVITFLADQNTLAHRGIFVKFFNLPASTITFPAKLALKYNAKIVFGYSYYNLNDYTINIEVEEISFEKTGKLEDDIKNLTQTYTNHIQKAIEKHPEQYLWIHKRWKTRPKGEPENIY